MVRFNPSHPAYRFRPDHGLAWARQRAAMDCPAQPLPCAAGPVLAAGRLAPGLLVVAGAVAVVAVVGWAAYRLWRARRTA